MSSSSFKDFAEASPWGGYLNDDSLTDVFITADIDWAPDYATQILIEETKKRSLTISLFATHDSPILKQDHNHVEVGLHPDYGRANIRNGLEYQLSSLHKLYPDAVGTRSHQNFFGQNTCNYAKALGLKYEASNIQWQVPFLSPHRDYNDMVRIPYYWEDGIHADMGLPWDLELMKLHTPGLKVINFHPIFVYLNCPDDDYRRKIVRNISDLTRAEQSVMEPQVFDGEGARTHFIAFLDYVVAQGIKTHKLSQLNES